ncbi:hypothetical protein [Neptuniibacter sp. QD37_11]|uniref:hypothetical protein n=1 Tax=Neptuniibacter sp. QD37_11 TaxID=3398209 RepID=UPI0039F58C07
MGRTAETSDIVDHTFSDTRWSLNSLMPNEGDDLCLYQHDECTEDGEAPEIDLTRDDVEALAKHFGLIK